MIGWDGGGMPQRIASRKQEKQHAVSYRSKERRAQIVDRGI